MAKHAKKSKKKTTRRRRIGGMKLNMASPKVNMIALGAGVVGGLIWGDKLNEQIDKIAPPDKVDGKLVAGGEVGLGAAYVLLVKKKNAALSAVSGVLIGAGVKRGMKEFGIGDISINGYQNVKAVAGQNGVAGYQDVRTLNGATRRKVLGANNPGNGGMGMNATKIAISSNGLLTRDRLRA